MVKKVGFGHPFPCFLNSYLAFYNNFTSHTVFTFHMTFPAYYYLPKVYILTKKGKWGEVYFFLAASQSKWQLLINVVAIYIQVSNKEQF